MSLVLISISLVYIVVLLLSIHTNIALGFMKVARRNRNKLPKPLYLFGFGGRPDPQKEAEKQAQLKIQQEILARRKNPKSKDELVKKVDSRREEVAAKVKKTVYSNLKDEEDPLEVWRNAKERGYVKSLGYEAQPQEIRGQTSIFGLNIPIPLSPIDRPEMDNGERFDLRLPYAERGYVDTDEKSISNAFSRLFGSGTKTPPTTAATNQQKSKKK